MEEVRRVGFADSRDEERVVGVNGPAKAQGGVDPIERESQLHGLCSCDALFPIT